MTNEHVIKGNRKVVIEGINVKKQMSHVRFTDTRFDLAFLEVPENLDGPDVKLGIDKIIDEGE